MVTDEKKKKNIAAGEEFLGGVWKQCIHSLVLGKQTSD